MNKGTRERYDAFCSEYHINGNNGTKAAIAAGYTPKTAHVQATKMLRIPYIIEKLASLKDSANEVYTITLEQRLKWLEEVAKAGLDVYHDSTGAARREGLNATVQSVKELNAMLGNKDDDGKGEETLASALSKLADKLPC